MAVFRPLQFRIGFSQRVDRTKPLVVGASYTLTTFQDVVEDEPFRLFVVETVNNIPLIGESLIGGRLVKLLQINVAAVEDFVRRVAGIPEIELLYLRTRQDSITVQFRFIGDPISQELFPTTGVGVISRVAINAADAGISDLVQFPKIRRIFVPLPIWVYLSAISTVALFGLDRVNRVLRRIFGIRKAPTSAS